MIAIRAMTAADIPLGMRLKDQAGWNQTEADWHRLLALDPEGCFVAELDGRAVGTTATTLFGPIGWISMVLVEASVRRLGIGTRLLEHALAYLDRAGAKTVRLDATPLGRPVYEKLGFVEDYELARWEGVAGRGLPEGVPAFLAEHERIIRGRAALPSRCLGEVQHAGAESLAGAVALDFEVTGTSRRRLIERLCQERPDALRLYAVGGGALAYCFHRHGSRAVEIGPLVARRKPAGAPPAPAPGLLDIGGILAKEDTETRLARAEFGMMARGQSAGWSLADAMLVDLAGLPILVDIPAPNTAAIAWATSHGLTVQRPFVRMHRGPPVLDEPKQIWASFGPEKG